MFGEIGDIIFKILEERRRTMIIFESYDEILQTLMPSDLEIFKYYRDDEEGLTELNSILVKYNTASKKMKELGTFEKPATYQEVKQLNDTLEASLEKIQKIAMKIKYGIDVDAGDTVEGN